MDLLEELHALAAGHKASVVLDRAGDLGRLLEPVVQVMAQIPEVAFDIRLSTQVNGIRVDVQVQAPNEVPRHSGLTFPYEVAARPPA